MEDHTYSDILIDDPMEVKSGPHSDPGKYGRGGPYVSHALCKCSTLKILGIEPCNFYDWQNVSSYE